MKKILFVLMLSLGLLSFGSSNLDYAKQEFKYSFIKLRQKPQNFPLVAIADRLEADALLELATENYVNYHNYNESEVWSLVDMDEIILIMPRIDLLEKHLKNLATKTEIIYLFVMENDKLDGEYGDRSFETLVKSRVLDNLPRNVEVFKLRNQSVGGFGNRYAFGEIQNSAVFQTQILPIYNKKSRHKIFDYLK